MARTITSVPMTTRSSHDVPRTLPLSDDYGAAPADGHAAAVVDPPLFSSLFKYHECTSVRRAVQAGFEQEYVESWSVGVEAPASLDEVFARMCAIGDVRWRHHAPSPWIHNHWEYIAFVCTDDAEIRLRLQYKSRRDTIAELQIQSTCASFDRAKEYADEMRTLVPKWERPDQSNMTPVTFWSWNREIRDARTKLLPAVRWEDVATGYTAPVRSALAEVMSSRADTLPARLHLWSGPPGTGKTHAIQALGDAWRDWADLECVTDPEVFFGSANYMNSLVHEVGGGKKHGVLVLEDAGEYLRPDAPAVVGQGFSRLLNLTDGMLGQGLNLILLITTNVEIRDLHPAASRPGRAASNISFGALTADEGAAWLTDHGHTGEMPTGPIILADLYARLQSSAPVESRPIRPAVGFSAT